MEIADFDKIEFPLTVRTWKDGDRFYPLGMRGRSKKLSDFLKDQKINTLEKRKVRVLSDRSGHIIWVIGHRLDDRFKVTTKTIRKVKLSIQSG